MTNNIKKMVSGLQKENPTKEFSIRIYEENMYWCVNWKSSKHWKTDKLLKEYFQIQVYNDNGKYSLLGEHRIEDIFEQLSEEYFLYKEKTMKTLTLLTNEIIQKTKLAVLEAVDKEFDADF
ncbi:hypothetical protein ACFQ5N_01975 [Lutibacter holmesii]|uniref:His-Xaa-Ser system protein HxsD n=1 Tax=Lutibacter holmesii TaxID=1137985 RepID=A0ABW3WLQ9_9FLAO